MRNLLLALSCFSFFLFGCNDDDKKTRHLNIVGATHENYIPSPSFKTTWTNAALNPLGSVNYHSCGFADGQDAYYGGHNDEGVSSYWKNGELVTLNGFGLVTSIFVSGGDVYCAGFIRTEENDWTPVYWKNKEMTVLTGKEGEFPNNITSIFVSGSDVYVTGNYNSSTGSYWKNGKEIGIHDDSVYAIGIAVSNNDVYVTGWDGNDCVSIKNGVKTIMTRSKGSIVAVSKFIYVSGNDVFIAGQQIIDNEWVATYWKNGAPFLLNGTDAVSVKTSGEDLYVAGYAVDKNGGKYLPAYWQNSVLTKMELPAQSVAEYEIFDFSITN